MATRFQGVCELATMSRPGGAKNKAYIHEVSPAADSDDVHVDTKTMNDGGVKNVTLYEIYVFLTA